MRRSRRALVRALVGVALAVSLAGCTTPEPMPIPTDTPSASPSAEPSAPPAPPTAPVLDGTAADNHEFFDRINQELIASGAALNGAAFIDNLVAHGFPRDAMEVTPDRTAINEPADNITFSIRFGETCLLGQWGNIGYASLVADVLATGRCLVGTARPA
ncbi:DUF6993 domain-containing protein [Protaetiibacter larvae]|uniref:DUF6993 domain-containing protein n=1 Tax=Protaetiibacter larvae TaxID=2592654 RepID=A0A5C1YA00_9MICO|nr:hypothetical protein [Protaetiibacter larvae]QEO09677.1 hypothetical protein FLP23_06455 [Protaetiibacter larvae]